MRKAVASYLGACVLLTQWAQERWDRFWRWTHIMATDEESAELDRIDRKLREKGQ